MANTSVTVAIRPDVDYTIEVPSGDPLRFRLRADPPGIMAWLKPDAEGKMVCPEGEKADKFLMFVMPKKDRLRFKKSLAKAALAEKESVSAADRKYPGVAVLGDKVRHDMAQTAYANSQGFGEIRPLAARLLALTQQVAKKDQMLAEKSAALEAAASAPLEDSSGSTEPTRSGGERKSTKSTASTRKKAGPKKR